MLLLVALVLVHLCLLQRAGAQYSGLASKAPPWYQIRLPGGSAPSLSQPLILRKAATRPEWCWRAQSCRGKVLRPHTSGIRTAILSDTSLLVAEYGFPSTGIVKSQEQCIKPMLQHFVEAMAGFGRVPSATVDAKKDAAGNAYIEVDN